MRRAAPGAEASSGGPAKAGPAIRATVHATLAALAAPRRALALGVVVAPLLYIQYAYTPSAAALGLGALLCAAFVLVAPSLWRVLVPFDRPEASLGALAVYGAVGAATVALLGGALPALLGLRPTFLTSGPSLVVSTALFWVGGWGLARDIDLELELAREKLRAEAARREAERAQLLALESHYDPHFLFNTLNAIAEWCREDGAVAERAILELSGMLRAISDGVHEPSWPLARELALVESLVRLHRVRDPEAFRFEVAAPAPLPSLDVPPLLLLPLAENAMKHGPARGHRGEVRLELEASTSGIDVRLENPGPFAGPRRGGRGLGIVERRLALAFGEGASLRVEAVGAARTRATLRLPLTPPAARAARPAPRPTPLPEPP